MKSFTYLLILSALVFFLGRNPYTEAQTSVKTGCNCQLTGVCSCGDNCSCGLIHQIRNVAYTQSAKSQETESGQGPILPTAKALPRLLHFYAEYDPETNTGWSCPACKSLEDEVFNDEQALNVLMEQYEVCEVNMTKQADVANYYGVKVVPYDIVLSADNKIIHEGVSRQGLVGYLHGLNRRTVERKRSVEINRSGACAGPNCSGHSEGVGIIFPRLQFLRLLRLTFRR